jgi:hypothetical protein
MMDNSRRHGPRSTLGWSWSASDRTIRNSSHPAGCGGGNNWRGFDFGLTCLLDWRWRYANTFDVR